MSEALRELLCKFIVEVDPEGNLEKGEAKVDGLKSALAQLEARLAGLKQAAAPAADAISAAFGGAEQRVGNAIRADAIAARFGAAPAASSDGFAAAGAVAGARKQAATAQGSGVVFGPTRSVLEDFNANRNRAAFAFESSWRGRFAEFQKVGGEAFQRVSASAAQFAERVRGTNGLQAIFSLRNALLGLGALGVAHQVVGIVDAVGSLGERAQKLGVSVEEFQRLDVLARQNNTSVEALGGAFRTLATSAVNPTKESTEAFRQLGVTLRGADGSFKSRNDLFFESAEALADVSDGTERAGLAQKVFGRSAQELLPLLANGSAGVRSQRAELMKLAVISDAEAQAADKLSDRWAAAGQSLQTKFTKALLQHLPLIEKVADRVLAFGEGLADFVSKLNPVRIGLAGLATAFVLLDASMLPVALSAAALALAFIAVEDFIGFLQGADSETGLLAETLFGKAGADGFRTAANDVLQAVKEIWDFISGHGVGEKLQQLSKEFNDAANFFQADVAGTLGLSGTAAKIRAGIDAPAASNAATDNRTQQVTVNVGSAAEVPGVVSGALQGLDAAGGMAALGAVGG